MGGRWSLRHAPSDFCLGTALLLGIYLALRAWYSPVTAYAREDLYIILACGVAYTLGATALSDARIRMLVLWVLAIITVGNLIVGFIHFSGRWTFHIVPHYMRSFGEGQRIGGFFNNSNHLAAYLNIVALLFGGMTLFGRLGTVTRLCFGFLSLLSMAALAMTMSRGGMLGLAAGLLVLAVTSIFLLKRTYPHLIGKLLLGLGMLAIMGGITIFGVFSDQLRSRFGVNSLNREDPRTMIWDAAQLQHETNPLLGAGARAFYDGGILHRTTDTASWMKEPEFVHNDWLQMLAEYGWVGLLLLATFILVHLLRGWTFLSWFTRERFPLTAMLASRNLGVVTGSMAALTSALVHGVVEFHFHVAAVAVTCALLFGFLANSGTTVRSARLTGVRPLLKLVTLLSGLLLIHGAWVYGRAGYHMEAAARKDVETDRGAARIASLDKAIALDDRNVESWYQRGLTLIEGAGGAPRAEALPMLQQAVADLEQAHQLNPSNHYILMALGDAYDANGRYSDAERVLELSTRLAPLYEGPRLSLAIHYHRLQNWEKAEEAYLWALEARAGQSGEWHTYYNMLLEAASRQGSPK